MAGWTDGWMFRQIYTWMDGWIGRFIENKHIGS
jgi:hypothetical protein